MPATLTVARAVRRSELKAPQQIAEASVRTERLEDRVHRQLRQRRVVFPVGALEPFEGTLPIPQRSVSAGKGEGGILSMGPRSFLFLDHPSPKTAFPGL